MQQITLAQPHWLTSWNAPSTTGTQTQCRNMVSFQYQLWNGQRTRALFKAQINMQQSISKRQFHKLWCLLYSNTSYSTGLLHLWAVYTTKCSHIPSHTFTPSGLITALCWTVTQCSLSAAHLYKQFLQVQQTGFVTLRPYAVHRGGCLELYYCNMVEGFWFWFKPDLNDQLVSLSAVDLVMWRVKIVPEMTYNVLSGTLSIYTTTTTVT